MTLRAQLAGAALAVALAAVLGLPQARAEAPAAAAAVKPTGNWREASLAEYRQHLVELGAIVDACAKARDTKTCDPALTGQDDHVPLGNVSNAERRLVSYGWLRALLSMAQQKDEIPEKAENNSQGQTQNKTQDSAQDKAQDKAQDDESEDKPQDESQAKPAADGGKPLAEEPTLPPEATTGQLLDAAEARLTQEIAQADAIASALPAAPADHAAQRAAMKQVLAGRDFRYLEAPTASDSALEKLGAWLNRLWASAAKLRSTRPGWGA